MKRLTAILLITFSSTTTMAKEIKTKILIKATSEKVWSILINIENYPNWNPFIKSIKGDMKIGNRIIARIEPPQSKVMIFKPKILTYKTYEELSWLGHFLFVGLFDGEHKFKIVDNRNGTTTFIQSELFRGVLVPFFSKKLDNNTKKGFEEMNKKLKELAELR